MILALQLKARCQFNKTFTSVIYKCRSFIKLTPEMTYCRKKNLGCVPLGWSGSGPLMREHSGLTGIMVHQIKWWLISQGRFIDSFDLVWSKIQVILDHNFLMWIIPMDCTLNCKIFSMSLWGSGMFFCCCYFPL